MERCRYTNLLTREILVPLCYYPNTDAIIFVVDSADAERMSVAKGELEAMLQEEELRDAILLVFANKQDQKGLFFSSISLVYFE